MPQDLREAPGTIEEGPGFVHPETVYEMFREFDGTRITIEVELEFAVQTTGPLVTVQGVTLIAPAMWALLAAQSAYGGMILPYVVSSYRTYAEQLYLYNLWLSGQGNLAAPPGQSNHETGTALDITAIHDAIAGVMARFGWIRDVPGEAWHFHWVGF
jgi:hypothetical protein